MKAPLKSPVCGITLLSLLRRFETLSFFLWFLEVKIGMALDMFVIVCEVDGLPLFVWDLMF